MALRSTIFKVQLTLSDIDRGRYADHALTIARHPSETDERMMVRVIAFALFSSDALAFGRGLSDVDDPDLVERDLTGRVVRWIEVGLPDARTLLKACGRADDVVVVAYGRNASRWWAGVAGDVARARNLTVLALDADATQALARKVGRTMALTATIQEGTLWIGDAGDGVELVPTVLHGER